MTAAFLCIVTLVSQAEVVSQPEKLNVADLIQQLDADTLLERDAAEKALIALGPDVLSKLPTPDDRIPAEVGQRLARIRQVLEKQVATSITVSKTVTLTGVFELQKVLSAIEKQTGNRFALPRGGDTEVTVELVDTPFWQATDVILDQAGLDIVALGGQPNRLVLTARPPGARIRFGQAQYNGVFRIEPIRVFSSRDLRNPQSDVMRVTLEISWEPRLSPISMLHDMQSIEAQDQNGTVIETAMGGRRDLGIQPGMSAVEIELPLNLPEDHAKTISTLKGKLDILVPGLTEKFEFSGDLETARGVELKRAGATVILDQVRKSGEVFQVRMRLRFDESSNAFESHRTWVFANPAYLIGPDGEKIPNAGYESTGQSKNEVGVSYLFAVDGGLKGHKFIYETPATMIRQTIDYEVKDIELP
ncbi:MAG: hypothetical protein ABGX07_17485 [Pirellulaceae bacterium]